MRLGRFLRYWLPLLIWLGVIFLSSTTLLSAEHTSRYLVPFLRWLNPHISFSTIATLHFALRKLAHLAEYAVLAVLLFRALRSARAWHVKMPALFVGVWVACVIFAASDELHQSLIESRTASPGDVLIDSLGAFAGLIVYWAFATQKKRT